MEGSHMHGSFIARSDGILAGCPSEYNFLASNSSRSVNRALYGRGSVVSDARATGRYAATVASHCVSPFMPKVWYALSQTHIPYNSEGLSGPKIAAEVATAVINTNHEGDKAYRQQVWRMISGIYGDQKWYSLRFGCWLLGHIFQWLFNAELYVKPEATQTLRDLAPTSTFVYVPTHKSHLDYHMLSYILFSEGLACPHIAAGENLNLFVVGGIMRTCGAFFIRRAVKGAPDAALYKQVLDTYMRTLIYHGISTEFFIEGGRARDGRIAVPKLGLLSSCVDAALDQDTSKALYVVPTTITYDVPLEEHGLLRELLGFSKKKETLWQFLSAFGKLIGQLIVHTAFSAARPLGCGGRNGRVAVGFGKPISVQAFAKDRVRRKKKRGSKKNVSRITPSASSDNIDDIIAEVSALDAAADAVDVSRPAPLKLCEAIPPGSDSRRSVVAALGAQVHAGMLHTNVIPSSAVLAACLLPPASFADPSPPPSAAPGVPIPVLQQRYTWIQNAVRGAGFTCMELPLVPSAHADAATFLRHLARICEPYVHYHRDSQRTALVSQPVSVVWQHARLNYLLPALAPAGLVVCAMLACAGAGGARRGSAMDLLCATSLPQAEIEEAALWLRKVLAPELNDALGADAFTTRAHVAQTIGDMTAAGLLFGVVDRDNLEANGASRMSYGAVRSQHRSLAFPASLLQPLIASYAAVLHHCGILLSGGPAPCKALVSAVLDRVRGELERVDEAGGLTAVGPVPSQLLTQHAVDSWMRTGILQTVSSDEDLTKLAAAPAPGCLTVTSSYSSLGEVQSRPQSATGHSPGKPNAAMSPSRPSQNYGGLAAHSSSELVSLPADGDARILAQVERLQLCRWR